MKLNMKKLIALGLALALAMSSLTPSYASAANKSDKVDEIVVDAEVVEEATTEATETDEVSDAIQEAAFNSTVVTTVEVADCAMTLEQASEVAEEALGDSTAAEFTDVSYEVDDDGVVTAINVISDESVAMAAAEIDAIAEGDTTSELTREDVLAKYMELQYFYEMFPQYFGVPVPYFVEKGPINSLLAVIAWGMTWDYVGMDFDGDGVPEMSLDLVAQVIDGYYQALGACLQGDEANGIYSLIPKLEAAKADALAQIDGNMSTEEKLLALNDWLANWCVFDMARIEKDENADAGKTPEQLQMENFCYMIETTLFGALVGAENIFGMPANPKTMCIGYTAAYTYLVQNAFPEIYQNEDGSWKTKDELNKGAAAVYEQIPVYEQEVAEDGTPVVDEAGSPVFKKDENGDPIQAKNEDGSLKFENGALITPESDPTYMIDFVQIKWKADVSMLGEDKTFTETHFFNAVRTNIRSDKWFYIDPCYNDIYVECMGRNRVETDGNMTHSYFLISHTSLAEQFDGNYEKIDTLYEDKATYTDYEEEWFTSATGPIVNGGDYYYYVKNSSIEDSNLNDSNFDISMLFDGKDQLIARNRSTGETTVLLDYTEGTGKTTGGKAITGADAIAEVEAQAMDEKYSSIIHTVAKKGNTLFLNAGNMIFTYDLESGEIKPFKEYNVVSATQDKTNPFIGMSYSIVPNGSDNVVYTVENHPISGIAIKSDGKLYVSVGTNFSKASGYAYEETNYNKDYVNYGGFSQGGDNDNEEFLWSANFVETIDLDCAHTYETVEVAANCAEAAYTENRCTACGAIEVGTKKVVEGSEPIAHHYVKHEETYYTEYEEEAVKGTTYTCIYCLDSQESLPEGASLNHKLVADAYNWSEDFESCDVDLVCEACNGKVLDCVIDDTTNKQDAVACEITKEYSEGYSCTEGGTVTHTAVWSEDGCTGSEKKEVQAKAGTHMYDSAVFNWSEDGTTCTADVKCKIESCANSEQAITVNCTVTSKTTPAKCLEEGKTVYTAKAVDTDGKVIDTDKKTVAIAATGHTFANNGEFKLVKDPTCTKEGIESRVCSVCRFKENRAIAMVDHTWAEEPTVSKKPTCTETGVQSIQCTECEEVKEGTETEVPKLEHEMRYKSNRDATCTEDGTKRGECIHCDYTEDKVPDAGTALGHYIVDATCTDAKHCKRCDYVEGEALGHDLAEYKLDEGTATCTTEGTETAKCKRCGETSTRVAVGSALGHDLADATCTEAAKCSRCDYTEGEVLGHNFVNYVSDGDATCTEDGHKTAKCERCDVTDQKVDEGTALGHKYGENDLCERCEAEKPYAVVKFTSTESTSTYNGSPRKLGTDRIVAEGTTGEVGFKYYIDKACEIPTFEGEDNEGTAPVDTGVYYVKAYAEADENYRESISEDTFVFTIKPKKVSSVKASNISTGIKVEWKKSVEADGYLIYKGDELVKTYTKNTSVSYTDKDIKQGKEYTYSVAAYKNTEDGVQILGSKAEVSAVRVTVKTITNNNGSVKITWTEVDNAASYKVYRKIVGKDDSYKRIKTITNGSTSYTDESSKSIVNGKASYYYVLPEYKSDSDTVLQSNSKKNYYISRPTISSVTGSSKAFTVKWKKNSNATGYEITYSTSSSFKSAKTVKVTSNSTLSKKISSLTKNKKYYVKVRAYKVNDGVTYRSAWSGYKSVKTK